MKEIKGNTALTALLSEKNWKYINKVYPLPPRELQVAKLVCLGLNNAEIAKRLKMAPNTAKTHIRNIYRKTHVRNKISLFLGFVEAARMIQKNSNRG